MPQLLICCKSCSPEDLQMYLVIRSTPQVYKHPMIAVVTLELLTEPLCQAQPDLEETLSEKAVAATQSLPQEMQLGSFHC